MVATKSSIPFRRSESGDELSELLYLEAGLKVCKGLFAGNRGDELYGGYPWRYYRVTKSLDQKDYFEQYYNFWQRLVPDNSKSELFTPAVIAKINNLEEPRKIFERVFTFNPALKYDTAEQHVNNSLYFEIKTFLPGLFLVGDKLSMAHGLEERFPLWIMTL